MWFSGGSALHKLFLNLSSEYHMVVKHKMIGINVQPYNYVATFSIMVIEMILRFLLQVYCPSIQSLGNY